MSTRGDAARAAPSSKGATKLDVTAQRPAQGRRVALFGGTFDPVHLGHMAVAHAAQRRFRFDQIYFIPAGYPPHKPQSKLSPFVHRYAMTTLACAENSRFVPSLAEAGAGGQGQGVAYSVDTVRHFLKTFSRPDDHLYFLLGADSFLHLASWRSYDTLLELCDFIVASRPGFSSSALRAVIPGKLLAEPQDGASRGPGNLRVIALRRTKVYVLDKVASPVSATEVRERLDRGESVRRLVPARVEEYITKQALYK